MKLSKIFLSFSSTFLLFIFPTATFAQTLGLEICKVKFTTELRIGDNHPQVQELQKFLNSDKRTIVSKSGPGSPGSETKYFGNATHVALKKLQTLFLEVGLQKVTEVMDINTRKIVNDYCNNYNKGLTKSKNTDNPLSPNAQKFSSKVILTPRNGSKTLDSIRLELSTTEPIQKPTKDAVACDGCTVSDIRKISPTSYLIFLKLLEKNWSVFIEADKLKNTFGNSNETTSNIVDNKSIITTYTIPNNAVVTPPKVIPTKPYQNLLVAEFNTPQDEDYNTYLCPKDINQIMKVASSSNKIKNIPFAYESQVYFFDKSYDKSGAIYKNFIGDLTGKRYGLMSINNYSLFRLDTKTSRFDFTRRIGDYNRVPRGSLCGTNAEPKGEGFISGKYIPIGNLNSQTNFSLIKKYSQYSTNEKENFQALCLPEWDKYSALETTNFCTHPNSKVIYLPEATIKYYFGKELDLKNELDIKKVIGSLFEIYTPSGSCHLANLWGVLPDKYQTALAVSPFLNAELEKYTNISQPSAHPSTPGITLDQGSLMWRPVPLDNDPSTKTDAGKKDITSGLGCLEHRKKYSYWGELEKDELWNQEFLNFKPKNDDAGGMPE